MGQNQTVPKRYPKSGTRLVIAGEWMFIPQIIWRFCGFWIDDLWKSEAPAPQKALRAPWQHPTSPRFLIATLIWAEQKLKRSNTKAWFGMGYQYVSISSRDRMSHNGNRPFAIFWIYGCHPRWSSGTSSTTVTSSSSTVSSTTSSTLTSSSSSSNLVSSEKRRMAIGKSSWPTMKFEGEQRNVVNPKPETIPQYQKWVRFRPSPRIGLPQPRNPKNCSCLTMLIFQWIRFIKLTNKMGVYIKHTPF